MATRSLIVAAAVLACVAIPLSAVQAKSNNSHGGNNSANHQGSQGNSSASAKSGGSTGKHPQSQNVSEAKQKPKKNPKVSHGMISFTKHYDQSSP
jgi:hypothetical protein